ncbi:MAG: BamA/TamA family outer membrane protein [Deltaproteobacteria bacterium]|nr:BamA/TamA family outer membrane protein [Deltaproteobacteria bacterium]
MTHFARSPARPWARRLITVAALLAAPGAARAAPLVETSSTSSATWALPPGERSDGDVTLILAGMSWSGWGDWCEPLRQYLGLGPPPFSPADAQRAEALLLDTSFFAKARCVLSEGRLICAVEPHHAITEVELDASLPFTLLREDLDRRMSLRPGALLERPGEDLSRQAQRLREYLAREGFFASRATLRAEPAEGAEPARGYSIRAEVDSGSSTDLGRIILRGDPVLTTDEIEDALRHYWILWFVPMRFRPELAAEDVERLAEIVKARGYPEATIDLTADPHPELGLTDVTLDVRAGPHLSILIEGNQSIDADDLLEEATFAEAGAIDLVEVERTGARIRRAYQEEGFFAVEVHGHTESKEDGSIAVRYRITEGARAFIDEVLITGASAVPSDEILEEVSLRTRSRGFLASGAWVDEWVARDVEAIRDLYANRGYGAAAVGAQIEISGPGMLRARFEIAEGARRTVGTVELAGLPAEIDRDALIAGLRLHPGEPYRDSELGADRRTLLTALASAGYPRAEVSRKLKVPQVDAGGEAEIHYQVRAGPSARFAGLLIRGNVRTVPSVIEDQLELSVEDPLDLNAIGEAKQRLRRLGIFSSVEVKPIGLGRDQEPTWLLVTVEERDRRTLDGVVSFSTSDYFSLGLDYRDRNLFGRAINLELALRFANASEIGTDFKIGQRDSIDLRLESPRPFGIKADLQARGFYQAESRETYDEQREGGSLTLIRPLLSRASCGRCPAIVASLGYELSASEQTLKPVTDPGVIGPPLADPIATIGRLVPRLTFDRRDSFVDPRHGYFVDLRFELANRVLAGPFFDAARNFWRAIASAQGYLELGAPLAYTFDDGGTLAGPLVLAALARYSVAHPYGFVDARVQPVPLAETFAYGGDLSVRGLTEGASKVGFPGANYLFVGSLELRFYLLQDFSFGSIQLAAFADLGAAGYHLSELFDAPTIGVGPALRYVTPIGPLSLAYGWPIVRSAPIVAADLKQEVISPTGRFHLSFGATF